MLSAPTDSGFFAKTWLLVLVLSASVILAYSPALSYPPTFDSVPHFGSEQHFLDGSLASFNPLKPRAIANISFYLVWWIFGGAFFWQILFNVLIHAANAVLIFFLFRDLLSEHLAGDESRNTVFAFFAALLFGLHPVGVYATAYVIQRSLLLALFFGLVLLILFRKAWRSEDRAAKFWFVLSALAYFLAVQSKEHAAPLPALCLLFVMRVKQDTLKKLAPPFCIYGLILLHVLATQAPNPTALSEPQAVFADRDPKNLFALSVINQAGLFFVYAFFWLFPDARQMAVDLHFAFPKNFGWSEIVGACAFLGLGLFGLACLGKKSERRLVGLAILMPMTLFLTEFATIRFSENFVLYRSVFWLWGLLLVIPVALKRIRFKTAIAGLTLLVFAFLVLQQERLRTFASPLTLWQDAFDKLPAEHAQNPASYRPYYNLAYEWIRLKRPEKALPLLARATELMPRDPAPRYNTGFAYEILGDFDKAAESYRKTLELDPNYARAHNNLGTIALKKDQSDAALEHFKKAAHLDPKFAEAYNNMGVAMRKLGNDEVAEEYFEKALAVRPDYSEAHLNLANVEYASNSYEEAAEHYQAARVLFDSNADLTAAMNWGNALAKLGKFEKALEVYNALVAIQPDNARAWHNAGVTLEKLGRTEAAKAAFEKARQNKI